MGPDDTRQHDEGSEGNTHHGRCETRRVWVVELQTGTATSFWLATGDVETLRVQGDWQSLAFREYLSLPSSARSGVASVLLGGLS